MRRLLVIAAVGLATTFGAVLALRDEETLPAQPGVANCDRPAAKPADGEVLVYLAKRDFGRRFPGGST